MGDGFGLPFTRRQFLAALSAGTSLMAVGPRQVALAQGMELSSPGPADWPRFGYDLHNTRFNACAHIDYRLIHPDRKTVHSLHKIIKILSIVKGLAAETCP